MPGEYTLCCRMLVIVYYTDYMMLRDICLYYYNICCWNSLSVCCSVSCLHRHRQHRQRAAYRRTDGQQTAVLYIYNIHNTILKNILYIYILLIVYIYILVYRITIIYYIPYTIYIYAVYVVHKKIEVKRPDRVEKVSL